MRRDLDVPLYLRHNIFTLTGIGRQSAQRGEGASAHLAGLGPRQQHQGVEDVAGFFRFLLVAEDEMVRDEEGDGTGAFGVNLIYRFRTAIHKRPYNPAQVT